MFFVHRALHANLLVSNSLGGEVYQKIYFVAFICCFKMNAAGSKSPQFQGVSDLSGFENKFIKWVKARRKAKKAELIQKK